MNYIDKMNSINNCATGLCECPEHNINNLVWIVPIVIGVLMMTNIYKKYMQH